MDKLYKFAAFLKTEGKTVGGLLKLLVIYFGYTRWDELKSLALDAMDRAVNNETTRKVARWNVDQFVASLRKIGAGITILMIGTAITFVLSCLGYDKATNTNKYADMEAFIMIASLVPLALWSIIHWSKIDAIVKGGMIIGLLTTESAEVIAQLLPAILTGGGKIGFTEGLGKVEERVKTTMRQISAGFYWLFIFCYHLIAFGLYKNPVMFLFAFVAGAIFFHYKKAYDPKTIFWRKSVLVSVLEVTLVTILYVNSVSIEHYGRIAAPSVFAWWDGNSAKAESDQQLKERIKLAETERQKVMKSRSEAAIADIVPTGDKIAALEKDLQADPNSKNSEQQRKDLEALKRRLAWDLKGRIDNAPIPPAEKPTPQDTCSDTLDNDGDGYSDKDDYRCYMLAVNCTDKEKKDQVCVFHFGNYDNGKNITVNNDGKPPLVWFRYNGKLDERKEPKWAKDRAEKEKVVASGSGDKPSKESKQQAQLDYIDKCFDDPAHCKL